MDEKQTKELVNKYNEGLASEEERSLLETWYLQFDADRSMDMSASMLEAAVDRVWNRLEVTTAEPKRIIYWPRYAAAAAVILFLSGISYFLLNKHTAQLISPEQTRVIHIGGNKAVLTLSNGEQIVLTGAHNGQLATDAQAAIIKTADGKLVYNSAQASGAETVYNTITTPKGGQYWVTLPDGSSVLLNASSSLKYPVAFNGKERDVELTGEAWFEVVHNSRQPFYVHTQGQTVEDLGTHFNINAYADEPATMTTLLQGSAKVIPSSGSSVVLLPGQQTKFKDSRLQVINDADTEASIGWVNGNFVFNSEDLASIARKLSRWYDVDISYQDAGLAGKEFTGSISRYKDVSEVLNMLQLTGLVHFKIKGREISAQK